jgi:hypothetical protein
MGRSGSSSTGNSAASQLNRRRHHEQAWHRKPTEPGDAAGWPPTARGQAAAAAEMTERETAREEIYAARESARIREAEKPLAQVIRETYEARRLEYQPIGFPDEPAPRVLTYWEHNGRFSALRRVAIPEPVKTDRWGARIR